MKTFRQLVESKPTEKNVISFLVPAILNLYKDSDKKSATKFVKKISKDVLNDFDDVSDDYIGFADYMDDDMIMHYAEMF